MEKLRTGGFLLSKIHQLSGRIFNRLLRDADIDELNGAQGRIMFVLWENDNIPITDLAKKSMLSKSTLTSMLDKLEQTGFVKRVYDRKDRRKIRISRTDKDRAYQETFRRVSATMTKIWYNEFTDGEIDSFEASLQKILENLINNDVQ